MRKMCVFTSTIEYLESERDPGIKWIISDTRLKKPTTKKQLKFWFLAGTSIFYPFISDP